MLIISQRESNSILFFDKWIQPHHSELTKVLPINLRYGSTNVFHCFVENCALVSFLFDSLQFKIDFSSSSTIKTWERERHEKESIPYNCCRIENESSNLAERLGYYDLCIVWRKYQFIHDKHPRKTY